MADQPSDTRARRLAVLRRVAVGAWAATVGFRTATSGFAFNREWLLVYVATGLLAASIGRRRTWQVIVDWLPFAAVLVVYDLSRGAATMLGTPTLWHPQVDADRWMFFGVMPTVWLQERLKQPQPPWWEVVVSTTYMSFFILPYVVAAVLWLRDRAAWRAFVVRFVTMQFSALVVYVVMPAAPPWAAARCTAAQVADSPSAPPCMFRSAARAPDGGLLGPMSTSQPGAHQWVERISTRGWGTLHLHSARSLIDWGQANVNLVAAIPSGHAALAAMIAVFLWRRIGAWWRPVLVAYPLTMAFTLVYAAEHFVVDLLLGWALAVVVLAVIGRLESRRRSSARPNRRWSRLLWGQPAETPAAPRRRPADEFSPPPASPDGDGAAEHGRQPLAGRAVSQAE